MLLYVLACLCLKQNAAKNLCQASSCVHSLSLYLGVQSQNLAVSVLRRNKTAYRKESPARKQTNKDFLQVNTRELFAQPDVNIVSGQF